MKARFGVFGEEVNTWDRKHTDYGRKDADTGWGPIIIGIAIILGIILSLSLS